MTFVIEKWCIQNEIIYFGLIFQFMQPFILMACLKNVLSL